MTAIEFYKPNWILVRNITNKKTNIQNNNTYITNVINNNAYDNSITNNNTTIVQNIVSGNSTGFITGNGNVVSGTGVIVSGENNNIQGNNNTSIGGSGNTIGGDGNTLINTTNLNSSLSNNTYIGGDTIYFQSTPQNLIHVVKGEINAFNKIKNIHIISSGHNSVRPLTGVATNTEFILDGNGII